MKPHGVECICAQCELDRAESRGFTRGFQAATTEQGERPAFHAVSLLDYFAAKALAGICGDGIPGKHHQHDETARDAYAYAHAMLKQRARETPTGA